MNMQTECHTVTSNDHSLGRFSGKTSDSVQAVELEIEVEHDDITLSSQPVNENLQQKKQKEQKENADGRKQERRTNVSHTTAAPHRPLGNRRDSVNTNRSDEFGSSVGRFERKPLAHRLQELATKRVDSNRSAGNSKRQDKTSLASDSRDGNRGHKSHSESRSRSPISRQSSLRCVYMTQEQFRKWERN